MAKPELADGYTRIPNELIEALARAKLWPNESRVLWVVLRRTYGWQKERDRISLSQFEELTGLDRRHVSRALERLAERGILIKKRGGGRRATVWGLQKDYEKWTSTSKGTSTREGTSTSKGTTLVPAKALLTSAEEGTHKRKERNTIKKRVPKNDRHADHQRLMALYREAIREDEKVEKGKELSARGKENKAAQKILERGFTPEEAMECYRHFKGESFWRDKHLSLAYIAQNIGAWKESQGEAGRRVSGRPRESREQEEYYDKLLRSTS